jgi:hypothetical protein
MKIAEMRSNKLEELISPKFNKAFCGKPGFRLEALKPYSNKITYITDGYTTDVNDLAAQINMNLSNFNPQQDCLIPAGTGIINIMVGYYLANHFPNESIAVAFFQREVQTHDRTIIPEDYTFYRFYPGDLLGA